MTSPVCEERDVLIIQLISLVIVTNSHIKVLGLVGCIALLLLLQGLLLALRLGLLLPLLLGLRLWLSRLAGLCRCSCGGCSSSSVYRLSWLQVLSCTLPLATHTVMCTSTMTRRLLKKHREWAFDSAFGTQVHCAWRSASQMTVSITT